MTWSRPRRPGARGMRAGGGFSALVAATGAVLTLSACGAFAPDVPAASTTTITASPAAPTTPELTASATTSAATPSATRRATGAAAPTNVATLQGGNGSALALVLPAAGAPTGWAEAEPRDTGGYRMTVCGVDLEPTNPVDGAQKRWQASPAGPFLEEHVRVYTDHTARDVLAALKKAIPGCRSYSASDAQGGTTSYRVSQLPLAGVGTRTVAWRQRTTLPTPAAAAPTSTASGTAAASPGTTPTALASPTRAATPTTAGVAPVLTQDVAVTQRGSSIVLIASYAVNSTPQADVLTRAVKAVPGR